MQTPISLSEKESHILTVMQSVVEGNSSCPEAATQLDVDIRTIFRLKARYQKEGADGLRHRSRGKESPRRIGHKERQEIEELLCEKYFDLTPTHASEKLSELHGIHRDRKTISVIMETMGLRPRGRRRKKVAAHRLWREPKSHFGEMGQFDGSYHEWFADRWTNEQGTFEACLLSSIDDATGKIGHARFAPHEGVLPVMGFWTEYIRKHGVPHTIYLDKFSTYKMNHITGTGNSDTLTQFERAMEHLRCTVIHAHSPQAKGRVERLFQTLQDRLVKELRLADVNDPTNGNVFIERIFLPDFNKRFGRDPFLEGDFHRELSKKELEHLPEILSRHDERILRHDFTITHGTKWYQLNKTPGLALRPKDPVEVRTYPNNTVRLFVRGTAVHFLPIEQKTRITFRDKNRALPQTLVPDQPAPAGYKQTP